MKLSGYQALDPVANRVARDPKSEKIELNDVPVYVVFKPDQVDLNFIGDRHVPQLRVSGNVERVVPAVGDMPFDIREITFNPADPPRVSSDYSFTTEQLKTLVDRGLYITDFEPPREMMTSVPWEYMMTTDITVVAPDHPENPPVVMVDLDSISAMEVNAKNSGYDLAEMFPDLRSQLEAEGRLREGEVMKSAPVVQGEYGDMFADVAFEESSVYAREADRTIDDDIYDGAFSDKETLERLSGQSLQAPKVLGELVADVAVEDRPQESRMTPWEREMAQFYQDKIKNSALPETLVATTKSTPVLREEPQGETTGVREQAKHTATDELVAQAGKDEFDLADLDGVDLDDLDVDLDDLDRKLAADQLTRETGDTQDEVVSGARSSGAPVVSPAQDMFDDLDADQAAGATVSTDGTRAEVEAQQRRRDAQRQTKRATRGNLAKELAERQAKIEAQRAATPQQDGPEF